jgi:hypothetical protein
MYQIKFSRPTLREISLVDATYFGRDEFNLVTVPGHTSPGKGTEMHVISLLLGVYQPLVPFVNPASRISCSLTINRAICAG